MDYKYIINIKMKMKFKEYRKWHTKLFIFINKKKRNKSCT